MQRLEAHLFDIVSVGHFSIDSIFLPTREKAFVVLGGSVAYVSFAARRLDSRVSVISRVGTDFPAAYKWWLQQEGIDLSGMTETLDAVTTRFELRYEKDLSNRSLCSKVRVPPIRAEDLPQPVKAKIIHLAPIAGEITYEVAERLKSWTETLSLDAQGLVRDFGADGNVSLRPPAERRILGLVDIFKSTPNEIQTLTGLSEIDSAIEAVHDHGVSIVIVTLGAEGSIVSLEHAIHRVPAHKPEKLVDPTGAGDAFVGAFLAEYARGEDCAWCSHVGSAAASTVIEGIGPTSFGDKEEIYRRARALCERQA